MSVPMAIALSGQPLLGQQVMVKPSEAEKNLVQSTATTSAASGGARKLYVGNLHSNITEDQLRQVNYMLCFLFKPCYENAQWSTCSNYCVVLFIHLCMYEGMLVSWA
jgi:hypothetical protein